MKRICTISLGLIVFANLWIGAQAQTVAPLSEAEIERRARVVGQSLRCVVCQNQSIDISDARLAKDMRKIVRDQIRDGKSNADIIAFMQDRYGDYVLLKPPLQKNTYILWFAPFVLLGCALLWYFGYSNRKALSRDELGQKGPFEALTESEQERLKQLKQESEL